MTTAHALQTPSPPRNLCSMDAAPILATMPKPAPVKSQAPQMTQAQDQYAGDSGSRPQLNGRTHADRLRQYEGIAPRANVGVSAQGNVYWAHGAMVAGHDVKTGVSTELLKFAAQTGQQTSAEVALAKISVENEKLSQADRESLYASSGQFSFELVAGKVHSGRYNSDGSEGFNAAATADLVNLEATADFSVFGGILEGSVTAGVGVGVGGDIGVGLRDQDNDGKLEVCARVGGKFGPGGTLGACLELPKLANLPRVRR